jgi:hypothetical protein
MVDIFLQMIKIKKYNRYLKWQLLDMNLKRNIASNTKNSGVITSVVSFNFFFLFVVTGFYFTTPSLALSLPTQ